MTGQVDTARKTLDANPHVMNAKYDEMIRQMGLKIRQYVDAASKVSAHLAKKRAAFEANEKEIAKLEQLRSGAVNIAKKVAENLTAQGKDPGTDTEYTQHRAAFNDFSSTLGEKMKNRKELEDAIKAAEDTNKNNLFTLKNLQRDFENLKKEQGEMVGRMIGSAAERELNESIAGLSSDTNNIASERQRMREMVMESEAAAQITGKIAGTDAHRAEEEYLDASVRLASNNEFDQLIGIAKKVENTAALPEGSGTSDSFILSPVTKAKVEIPR
jgi:hypothetical protein